MMERGKIFNLGHVNCWLKSAAFVLLVLFLIVSFLRPIETEDIWWHLKAGQYISEHHQVPYFDPFPFSTEITPWVLTQWLGSLFYFLIYQIGGLGGLQLARVVLFLIVIGIFYVYSARKIPPPLLFLMVLFMALTLLTRAHLRPFVFNFIFIQLFLIILLNYQKTSQFQGLLFIPLLSLVWVNLHLGSFMYGISLIGIFLFSTFIRILALKRHSGSGEELSMRLKHIKELTITLVLYLMTFLLTPYGLVGALHPLKTIFVKDYLYFNQLSMSIAELLPPIHLFSFAYLWFFVFFGAGIAALLMPKRKNFTHIMLFIFSFFLFIYGRRANVFFVLISSYIVAESLAGISLIQKWPSFKFAKITNRIVYVGLIIFLSVSVVGIFNSKLFVDGKVVNHLSVRKDQFHPQPALNLLKEHNIQGRVFNDDGYGGYLLWHTYPDLRPFVDNRQINYRPYFLYHKTRSHPGEAWPLIEYLYQINIAMLDSSKPISIKPIKYFLNHPGWSLIFVQGSCVVFVKKDAFDLPEHLATLERKLKAKDILLKDLDRLVRPPEKEGILTSIKKKIFPSYQYVEPVWTAATYFDLGFKGAAVEKMLEALTISDDPYSRNVFEVIIENLQDQ